MLTIPMPRSRPTPPPVPPPSLAPLAGSASRPPLDDDARWEAVRRRDRSQAGAFVYAVRSTGIYCRPGCPSRQPRRDGVRFYAVPEAAEAQGFRACRRCRPKAQEAADPAIRAARAACAFIAAQADQPLTLARIARQVGLSPFHLQREFSRVVGLSPRAFQDALRASRFKAELREAGASLAGAGYGAGYGSSSRVYERKPTGGVSPARYKAGGKGLVVRYTVVDSALGRLLVAGTEAGVCAVKLGDADAPLIAELAAEFPQATLAEDARGLARWARDLQRQAQGRVPDAALPLDVRGTAFQWQVWRYLQRIPLGETRSYSEVARAIRRPSAVRAVARACATNQVALAVPCHRVVGKDGSLTGYRWGTGRKAALLAAERR